MYMNSIKKVDTDYFISDEMGDYENPQSYWFYKLGAEQFRGIFSTHKTCTVQVTWTMQLLPRKLNNIFTVVDLSTGRIHCVQTNLALYREEYVRKI